MLQSDLYEYFISQEIFNDFKRQMWKQLDHLRKIMDIQHDQIDLLTMKRVQNSQEINFLTQKSTKIELQNQFLKLKINQLQASLTAYRFMMDQQKDKNQIIIQHLSNDTNELLSNQQQACQLAIFPKNKSINAPISKDELPKQQINKQFQENRRTEDNQQSQQCLQCSDDEELIQCVWQSTPKKYRNITNIQGHQQNPHDKEFQSKQIYKGISISKLNGIGFFTPSHNFIYKKNIPNRKISCYQAKNIKIRDIFLLGVATKNSFGIENAFRHRETATYASNGYIWYNGDSQNKGKNMKYNQTLKMIANRCQETLSWQIDNIEIHNMKIPKQMNKNELFLIIMMFNKDDSLELICLDE